jgi:hypothetical protein
MSGHDWGEEEDEVDEIEYFDFEGDNNMKTSWTDTWKPWALVVLACVLYVLAYNFFWF